MNVSVAVPQLLWAPHCTPWDLKSGGESHQKKLRRIVHENEEGGFDFLKVHGDVSPEAFDRLNDTAKRLGIRVTGHGQRHRGMQPVYEHHQDLAHIEEFLYAEFNPRTPGLWTAVYGGLLGLTLLSLYNHGMVAGCAMAPIAKPRVLCSVFRPSFIQEVVPHLYESSLADHHWARVDRN